MIKDKLKEFATTFGVQATSGIYFPKEMRGDEIAEFIKKALEDIREDSVRRFAKDLDKGYVLGSKKGTPITTQTFLNKAKQYIQASKEGGGMSKDHLLLKWGTLKAWDFSDNDRGKELLKEYADIGMCGGAAQQKDTPEQKEIICKLIDICNGDIYEDWGGKLLTKEQARDYVRGYGKEQTKPVSKEGEQS